MLKELSHIIVNENATKNDCEIFKEKINITKNEFFEELKLVSYTNEESAVYNLASTELKTKLNEMEYHIQQKKEKIENKY